MRRTVFVLLLVSAVFYCISCARGISTYEAANGKARCGKYLR
ncbi:MAG: hypothetical protein V9E88_07845 [Ferruginibacter sp.]